ncbi:NfeD family protein [candidate division WOR-3 bacterium]|nr:NfeD family protein [candidate division WOR-3 bacterium]
MWLTWIWFLSAAAFFVGEIFTAGFFLSCFGIGATAAGIVTLFNFHPIWQWVAFVVFSAISFAFARKFSEKVTKKQPKGIGADRLIGVKGIVIEKIDNLEGKGLTKVENEVWKAVSKNDEVIEEGTEIEVVDKQGVSLLVKPFKKGE